MEVLNQSFWQNFNDCVCLEGGLLLGNFNLEGGFVLKLLIGDRYCVRFHVFERYIPTSWRAALH